MLPKYLKMAEAVKAQAEAFLDAEGVPHDAPIPEADESRTLGEMVAAPLPEDRVAAALLVVRTAEQLATCRLQQMINPSEDQAAVTDRIAELMYRLRMYQDAMHSEELRRRYKTRHARKNRSRGADREGTAAWLVSCLTDPGESIDEVLTRIAQRGQPVIEGPSELPVVLKDKAGTIVRLDKKPPRDSRLHYQHKGKWASVTVRQLRDADKELRKPA